MNGDLEQINKSIERRLKISREYNQVVINLIWECFEAGGYLKEEFLKKISAHNLICICLTNSIKINFKLEK